MSSHCPEDVSHGVGVNLDVALDPQRGHEKRLRQRVRHITAHAHEDAESCGEVRGAATWRRRTPPPHPAACKCAKLTEGKPLLLHHTHHVRLPYDTAAAFGYVGMEKHGSSKLRSGSVGSCLPACLLVCMKLVVQPPTTKIRPTAVNCRAAQE